MTEKALHRGGWGTTDNTQINEIIPDSARFWEDDVIEGDATREELGEATLNSATIM